MSRRISAVVVGAVVVALLPLAPASATGDAIAYVGISAGQYLASGSSHVIGAEASTADSAESVDLYVDGVFQENALCVPAGTTCSVTFAFDASGLADGTHTTSVRLNTNVGNDVIRDGFTFFVGDAPVASITAPATGGTFTGSVDITVRGVTDPQGGDYPETFTLKNGATTIGTAGACASNAKDCSQTITWDISAVAPGTKSLTVQVTTHDGSSDTSSALTLTVGAAPTVSITVPTQNAAVLPDFVTGAVPVTITAGTDSALGSVSKSLSLFVDGAGTPAATASCTGAEVPCTKTVTWDATGLAPNSTHTLVARVAAGGVTINSATRTVRIANNPTVTLISPSNGSKVLPDSSEVVSFSANGTSDAGIGSRLKTFQLLIDSSVVDTATCTSTGACGSAVSLGWDTTGVAGGTTHTAAVRVTVEGRVATTSGISLTLADSPTVTVVAPPGGLIKGAATVTVTAQTDPDFPAEKPQSIVLTAANSLPDQTVTFGPITCDSSPVSGACTFTVPWDVSALSGSYTLTAELTTTNGRTRTSSGVVFGIDNPAPTVTLTAPTATVLKGRVTVSMTAKVEAPLTGHITSIALFAGGTQVGGTKACPVAATCTISAVWDTTLLANTTTGILAVTTTSNTGAQTFNSPTTTVTLRNPAPSITWISPANGSVVSGSAVTITVGLGTDATQSDLPKSAAIYRNGSSTPFDTYLCKATSHSCIATFTWNASKAAGLSTFVVKVRTTKDRVRFSSSTAPRKLYASSAARITFLPSTTVDNGRRVTVTGRMVAARTGLGIANAKVALVRDPAIGSTLTTTVVTNSTGRFTLTYTATSNTTVTARSVSLRTASGKIWMPPGTGVARQQVRAPMTCNAANRTLGPGQKGQGSCSVPGLPFGTPLFLRYLFGGKWTTLASGTSTTTRIPFFYQFPAKGSYQLRVILSGNKAYAGTNSELMPVTVR